MDDWVDNHLDWVKQVTQSFLSRKRMSFEQFRLQWLHSSFPLNSAGILILARAYKIHVAVFFNDHFWTTDSHTGLDRCSVFLLYRGNLVFENSRRLTTAEFDEKRCLMKKLEKYYATPEPDKSLDKLHERAKKLISSKNMIESDPDYSVEEVGSLPKDTSESGSSEVSSEISDHELSDVDIIREFMPTTSPDSSPEEDSDDSGIGDSPSKNLSLCGSQCECNRRMQESLKCAGCASCNKGKKPGNIMPEKQLDLEDMLNETEKAEEAQSENKLPSIEGRQIVPEIEKKKKLVVKLKRVDVKEKQENEPKKEQTEQNEEASSVSSVKEHKQTEPKKQETDQNEATSSDSSVEEVAPPKKARKPKTKIGLLVKDIMPNKYKRFVCPKRKCDRDYGSKRALHRHLLNNHSAVKDFQCTERWEDGTKCTKTYPNKQQLDQHIRGKHGEGFEAYCGEVFTWPWERNDHQKSGDCKFCLKFV